MAREITGHPIPTKVVARRAGDPAILLTSATSDATAPAPASVAAAAPNLPTPPLNAMASNTAGHSGAWLAMQGDGNLVVYSGTSPVWNSQTCCH